MSGVAVTLVDSGGIAVTAVDTGAPLMTVVDAGGLAVTLVDSGGLPFIVDGAGLPESEALQGYGAGYTLTDNRAVDGTYTATRTSGSGYGAGIGSTAAIVGDYLFEVEPLVTTGDMTLLAGTDGAAMSSDKSYTDYDFIGQVNAGVSVDVFLSGAYQGNKSRSGSKLYYERVGTVIRLLAGDDLDSASAIFTGADISGEAKFANFGLFGAVSSAKLRFIPRPG